VSRPAKSCFEQNDRVDWQKPGGQMPAHYGRMELLRMRNGGAMFSREFGQSSSFALPKHGWAALLRRH